MNTPKMNTPGIALAVLIIGAIAPGAAQANSIGEVENARAKERAGYHLSRQDREQLRRHGANDEGYGWRGGYGDRGYYDDGYRSGASIYVGPRHYDDE